MITERVQAAGSWDVQLVEDTPRRLLEVIDIEKAGFGQLVILPAHLDPRAHTDTDLLGLARYCGVYRVQEGLRLSGAGLGILLGDEDGKGDVFESVRSTPNGWLSQWVPALLPQALLAGTIDSPGGSMTDTFYLQAARECLAQICEYFGVEWRITPDLRLHVGRVDNLYGATPKVIILSDGDSGRDVMLTGVAAQSGWARDVEDYSTKVIYVTGDEDSPTLTTATIPEAQIPFGRAGDGGPIVMDRLVRASDDEGSSPSTMAAAQLGRFSRPRRQVTVAAGQYDIGHLAPVGSHVWLYAPPVVMDTSNQVVFRGRSTFPVRSRLVGATWPLRSGMGVYLRVYAPGRLDWYDLTSYVQWEDDAQMQLEVDALPRPSN
jgi:hypothetical protein